MTAFEKVRSAAVLALGIAGIVAAIACWPTAAVVCTAAACWIAWPHAEEAEVVRVVTAELAPDGE